MYRRHLDAAWTGKTRLTRRPSPLGQPKFNGYLCRCRRRCRGCSIVHGSSQKDDELVSRQKPIVKTSLIKHFCNFNLAFRLKRVSRIPFDERAVQWTRASIAKSWKFSFSTLEMCEEESFTNEKPVLILFYPKRRWRSRGALSSGHRFRSRLDQILISNEFHYGCSKA